MKWLCSFSLGYDNFCTKTDAGDKIKFFFFFKLGFTPCKTEEPLQGMELQEKKKKHKKDYRLQKIYLERTYS